MGMPEASDATAILNAQRPPEMTEAKPRPAKAKPEAQTSEAPAAKAADVSDLKGPDKRIDPEDDQELTLEELRVKYKSLYVLEDIEDYWKSECQPLKLKASPVKAEPHTPVVPSEAPAPPQAVHGAQRKTRRF